MPGLVRISIFDGSSPEKTSWNINASAQTPSMDAKKLKVMNGHVRPRHGDGRQLEEVPQRTATRIKSRGVSNGHRPVGGRQTIIHYNR
jgi:hypothetical protein